MLLPWLKEHHIEFSEPQACEVKHFCGFFHPHGEYVDCIRAKIPYRTCELALQETLSPFAKRRECYAMIPATSIDPKWISTRCGIVTISFGSKNTSHGITPIDSV